MARKYYTLVVWDGDGWQPQFGDYSRAVVKQERKDCYEGEVCKIVCTGDTQAEIDTEVAKLNEEG